MSVSLTHWFLDYNLSCCLHKRSNADGILGSHSEEVGLSSGKAASHSILSAGCERDRGPGLALGLTLFNDEVTDGGTTIILRKEPVELAGVAAQVLSSKGNANRSRDI